MAGARGPGTTLLCVSVLAATIGAVHASEGPPPFAADIFLEETIDPDGGCATFDLPAGQAGRPFLLMGPYLLSSDYVLTFSGGTSGVTVDTDLSSVQAADRTVFDGFTGGGSFFVASNARESGVVPADAAGAQACSRPTAARWLQGSISTEARTRPETAILGIGGTLPPLLTSIEADVYPSPFALQTFPGAPGAPPSLPVEAGLLRLPTIPGYPRVAVQFVTYLGTSPTLLAACEDRNDDGLCLAATGEAAQVACGSSSSFAPVRADLVTTAAGHDILVGVAASGGPPDECALGVLRTPAPGEVWLTQCTAAWQGRCEGFLTLDL